MNYKRYFEENNIVTVEDFFDYTYKNFCYGWMDKDKKLHTGVNDAYCYSLQSPSELIQSKTGICWDMTELYRCFFSFHD